MLNDTVKAMDVRENRVFYVIGSRRQLIADKVVTEEGGSRGLLIVKLGKTLAVGDFTIWSDGKAEPVAHATVTYAIPPNQ